MKVTTSKSFFSALIGLGAKIVAGHCTVRQFRHYAIAFTKKGHIIKAAANKRVEGSLDYFSEHAEAAIVRKLYDINAFYRYKDICLFIGRFSADGKPALSEPCGDCRELLRRYGFYRIYYTVPGGIEYLGRL